MTTSASEASTTADAGHLIQPVLADLAGVVGGIRPEQFGDPTPCPDYDVATLRRHVLGWVTFFAAALNDPDGATTRPEPQAFQAPDDADEAAQVVLTAAAGFAGAVDDGVADRPVLMIGSTMPGGSMLRMALWEYLMHGDDLARATGRPWHPADAAADDALAFAPTMLTDDYRGADKDFGPVVEVPDDAPALDRLLGFSGRDPNWAPAGSAGVR